MNEKFKCEISENVYELARKLDEAGLNSGIGKITGIPAFTKSLIDFDGMVIEWRSAYHNSLCEVMALLERRGEGAGLTDGHWHITKPPHRYDIPLNTRP